MLPVLKKHRLHGAFFPPVLTAKNESVLDVNLIHYVLASTTDHIALMKRLDEKIGLAIEEGFKIDFDQLKKEYFVADRFDPAEIIYIKRVLQKGLPEKVRRRLCLELLGEFLEVSEVELAKELYMNIDELKTLISEGMRIGPHGFHHCWLSSLDSETEIRIEIQESLKFMDSLGSSLENWIMCYPYGDFDERVLRICRELGCCFGLTTECRTVSEKDVSNPLILPRLDTNDLPKDRSQAPNHWYQR